MKRPQDPRWESYVTSHQGYRFHHRRLPGGRLGETPLLLLGGAFQTMDTFQPLAERFAERTDVLLVDLPGAGESDHLPPEHGAGFLADCLCRVPDHHGLERVDVVAVSFGTPIAHELARAHPGRVANLVLVGTMSRVDRRMQAALGRCLRALERGDRRGFAEQVCDSLLARAHGAEIARFERVESGLRCLARRLPPRAARQFEANADRLLLHRQFRPGAPAARTLVLTGEHDPLTTPDRCREVAASIPAATFTVVRGADHLAPVERPEVCQALVEAFLGGRSLREIGGVGPIERPGKRRARRRSAPDGS